MMVVVVRVTVIARKHSREIHDETPCHSTIQIYIVYCGNGSEDGFIGLEIQNTLSFR